MHEQLTTESAQGLVFSPSSSFSSSSPEANKQGALYRLTKDIIRINRGQRKKEAVFEAGTVEEAAKQGLGGIRLENVVASLVHDYVKPNLKYGVDQNHNISKWLRKRGKPEKYELNELQLAQLKESFELMDTDGSGSIDESELRDCLKILGVNLTKSEIKAIFLEVDADGSGSIEYNEFLLLMTKAWEVSIGKGSTSSSMNDSFDNFQAASSSYRRTRLLNSILQSDVEQTQQMVEKFFGFKEKELEMKRQFISKAEARFERKELRRREREMPRYGEYERRVEARLLRRGLGGGEAQPGGVLQPLPSGVAVKASHLGAECSEPAFGRAPPLGATWPAKTIKLRSHGSLVPDDSPRPLYREPTLPPLGDLLAGVGDSGAPPGGPDEASGRPSAGARRSATEGDAAPGDGAGGLNGRPVAGASQQLRRKGKVSTLLLPPVRPPPAEEAGGTPEASPASPARSRKRPGGGGGFLRQPPATPRRGSGTPRAGGGPEAPRRVPARPGGGPRKSVVPLELPELAPPKRVPAHSVMLNSSAELSGGLGGRRDAPGGAARIKAGTVTLSADELPALREPPVRACGRGAALGDRPGARALGSHRRTNPRNQTDPRTVPKVAPALGGAREVSVALPRLPQRGVKRAPPAAGDGAIAPRPDRTRAGPETLRCAAWTASTPRSDPGELLSKGAACDALP